MSASVTAVDVVLVRPACAGNVAAACRAMKNMGLRSLRLVDPPPALDAYAARSLAYGAWDVLDAAERHPHLAAAVAANDCVVGTSGRALPGAWTPRELVTRLGDRRRVALVFGPEATGLSRAELALCHAWVHIPADPDQPSLNLAQAVLLLAYELRRLPAPRVERVREAATSAEVEVVLDELRRGLLGIGYLNPQSPTRVLAELRRLLARARPTRREIGLLRGMARQIAWAGGAIGERDRRGA